MTKQGVFLRAMASDATEVIVEITGVIGWQVEFQNIKAMLRGIPESIKRVVFEIYSPGGDVWEGNGIIQEIGELGKRCETVARVQVAASMATLICVACQKRYMAANGRFLIHNAWSIAQGDAAEMEKMAQTLRDCETEASKFYAERTGGTQEAMLALMQEERWLMPDETKSLGFVQEISDPFKTEDYEAVKQEIVAAGKWPKALVELPVEKIKPEVISDGSKTNQVAGNTPAVEPIPPAVATDAPVVKTYEQGLAEAEINHAENLKGLQGVVELAQAQIVELKTAMADAIAKRDAQISEHQSAKDKAIAKATTDALAYEKRIASEARSFTQTINDLKTTLGDTTARLNKLLGGSMAFTPAPLDTWEEALAACEGDYEKAAKTYDSDRKLRNAYNQKHQTGKR